jgi:hypothetical protein
VEMAGFRKQVTVGGLAGILTLARTLVPALADAPAFGDRSRAVLGDALRFVAEAGPLTLALVSPGGWLAAVRTPRSPSLRVVKPRYARQCSGRRQEKMNGTTDRWP